MGSSAQVTPTATHAQRKETAALRVGSEPGRTHPASSDGIDLSHDLTPVDSILSHLRQRTHWADAAITVAHLVKDSALSACVGWIANFVFSFGNFVTGQSTGRQSYATFCAGVNGITLILINCATIGMKASTLLPLHFVDTPDRRPTLKKCVKLLVRRTYAGFLLSCGFAVGVGYGVASLPQFTHVLKLHYYLGSLLVQVYAGIVFAACRLIFLCETTEGRARGGNDGSNSRSSWKLALRMMVKNAHNLSSLTLGALFIHIASSLRLDSPQALLLFSIVSYALKLTIQELAKQFVLTHEKAEMVTIYYAIAPPTVIIDTQIRVVMLRQPNVNQSMAASVVMAVVEVTFRFMKVWLIRLEIWLHERNTKRLIMSERTTLTPGDVNGSRRPTYWWPRVDPIVRTEFKSHPRYIAFLHWRSRLLRFHAAEIHADMCAEYLAIACSMSIYFFFHAHPKYAWTSSTSNGRAEASSQLDLKQQAVYLLFQITMEMVIDFLSCLWELVNGVPLHNSKKIRSFLAAMFAGCSITNIMLSAALCIKST